MAYDPRIPSEMQAFEFVADGVPTGHQVAWVLNGSPLSTTNDGHFLWPVQRGAYALTAQEIDGDGVIVSAKSANFSVR